MGEISTQIGWNNLQVRNSALCEYFEFADLPKRTTSQLSTERNLSKTYKGEISKLSKKNIARALQLLLQSSPMRWYDNPITGKRNSHRLTFITLTFSCSKNVLLSEEYENSLKPFLRWLREVKKCDDYIWKAEYQKRGQLHYHITTNQFIRYDEIRTKWNDIQFKNGYLNEYYEKNNHYNAPSTEIAAVYKIDDIESYLIKYMMKDVKSDDNEVQNDINCKNVSGKVWGCSDRLRGKKYFTIQNINEDITEAIKSKIQAGKLKELENIEHCRYYKVTNKKDYKELFTKEDIKTIQSYAKSHHKSTTTYFNFVASYGCSLLLDTISDFDIRVKKEVERIEKNKKVEVKELFVR